MDVPWLASSFHSIGASYCRDIPLLRAAQEVLQEPLCGLGCSGHCPEILVNGRGPEPETETIHSQIDNTTCVPTLRTSSSRWMNNNVCPLLKGSSPETDGRCSRGNGGDVAKIAGPAASRSPAGLTLEL
jgi:hypothetical protein